MISNQIVLQIEAVKSNDDSISTIQWWIRDFPDGYANPWGSKTYYLRRFLPITAWKWKELDRGCIPGAPSDPLMGSDSIKSKHGQNCFSDNFPLVNCAVQYYNSCQKYKLILFTVFFVLQTTNQFFMSPRSISGQASLGLMRQWGNLLRAVWSWLLHKMSELWHDLLLKNQGHDLPTSSPSHNQNENPQALAVKGGRHPTCGTESKSRVLVNYIWFLTVVIFQFHCEWHLGLDGPTERRRVRYRLSERWDVVRSENGPGEPCRRSVSTHHVSKTQHNHVSKQQNKQTHE